MLFIPSLILGIIHLINENFLPKISGRTFAIASDAIFEKSHFFQLIETDLLNTLIGSFLILGGLLISFSKEKVEDEFIQKIRLSSFQWAYMIHFLFLFLCFLFIYGEYFWQVMVVGMFANMIIFIGRFHYLIYIHQKD